MIHKRNIIISSMLVLVAVCGYFLYPLVSPLFIDKVVNEAPIVNTSSMTGQASSSLALWTGSFVGFDRLHNGTGTVNVIQQDDSFVVRFESDFSVQNGPDLYVGFGKDGKYIEGSEISLLKGNIGSQNYVVGGKFDTEKYNEVWIWCKEFSVPFAKAKLI